MKKALLVAFILMLYPAATVGAEETINAGILPTVWYSDTMIYAGDEISIYGGMQNHSSSTIQAQVVFLVDGKTVSTADFVSKPDSLMEIEGKWKAVAGNHKVSLRITNAVPDNLLTKESQEVSLSVKSVISMAKVKEAVGEAAGEATETIISSLDNSTEALSDKILDLKKPPTQTEPQSLTNFSIGDEEQTDSNTVSDATRSAYNLALTFLASSVLHWKVTLAALILLFLIIKFTS